MRCLLGSDLVRPLAACWRLNADPYSFVWIDALTQKVREGGRTVNVLGESTS
jgi:hypothetical protein